MPDLEYKSLPFELKELVDVSGGGWEIAGYASTFGGEPDEYGDVIAPGAFTDSLAVRSPKHLFEHGEPIGKTVEIREDAHGLYGRWSIVDTTVGTDAYKLAKAGVLDSLSIGYRPSEWEYLEDNTRLLKKIDLYEVSSVAIPANKNARITDVKTVDETRAVWSSSYVNDLPDSSFALVLPGGSKDDEGKTTPRNLRKLPHHGSDGALDGAHVRNGLSRAPQMTGVSEAQRERAVSHLQKHLASLNKAAEHDHDDSPAIDIHFELTTRRLRRRGLLEAAR
jgi:HK97 family phage prohead protease